MRRRQPKWRQRIERSADRWPWLVAVDEGILGYAYAGEHRTRAAYRWSVDVSVYVAEHARRRGVGRRLYAALCAVLREQGFHNAFAGIALPNDASLELHRAAGFMPVGVYRDVGYKLGAWRDVAWLQRQLLPPSPAAPEPRPFAELREHFAVIAAAEMTPRPRNATP